MHTHIRELNRDRRDIANPGQQNTEISRASELTTMVRLGSDDPEVDPTNHEQHFEPLLSKRSAFGPSSTR